MSFHRLLVSIPLIGLYEVGIVISARVLKKKEKERDEFMEDNNSPNPETTTT